MDSGSLPILFTSDTGCQTEVEEPGVQYELHQDNEDEEVDEDDEWVLEQIELAYKRLPHNTPLAMYEKRRGLSEVKAEYRRLCAELGEETEDGDTDEKETNAALREYRTLMKSILKLRGDREAEVRRLCEEIATIWRRAAFVAPDDDFYTEVTRTAVHMPRKHGSGVFATTALIPRNNRLISVHRNTTEVLFQALAQLRSHPVGERACTMTEKSTSLNASTAPSLLQPTAPAVVPNAARLIWEEEVKPMMVKLHLIGTEWGQRMEEVVAGAEDGDSDMQEAVLRAASQNLTAAAALHEEVTEGLKRVVQDSTMVECFDSLPNARLSRVRSATRANEVQSDASSLHQRLAPLAATVANSVRTFPDRTHGLPYIPDPGVADLLGIPRDTHGILCYLAPLCPGADNPPLALT